MTDTDWHTLAREIRDKANGFTRDELLTAASRMSNQMFDRYYQDASAIAQKHDMPNPMDNGKTTWVSKQRTSFMAHRLAFLMDLYAIAGDRAIQLLQDDNLPFPEPEKARI